MNRQQTAVHAAELRKQAAELIRRAEVEEGFAQGGEVCCFARASETHGTVSDPSWNWDGYDYRPKPKPVERWMNIHPDGSCFYFTNEGIARSGIPKTVRTIYLREVKQP